MWKKVHAEAGVLVLKISSPGFCGWPNAKLLTRLCFSPSSSQPFSRGVLYLHGFPDQSLDHRREEPTYGAFCSRFPQKLAETVLKECHGSVFVAFNFAGTPGSDKGCPFLTKTVGREIEDTRAVINYLRGGLLPPPAPLTIVGLSTGAIIASLLRGCDPHLSVAVVASLLDTSKGLHYDFSDAQLADFDAAGFCLKEFYLPAGSPSNPPDAEIAAHEAGEGQAEVAGAWCKHYLRLGAAYRADLIGLDVAGAIKSGTSPLLVVHGVADKNVPIANGEELFAAASEPKKMLKIPKGNHLLSNSKDFQKAARAICDLANGNI